MPYLSLTTWSLHRELGSLRWTYWDDITKTQKTRIEEQPENLTLLALPFKLAEEGFKSLEVCHFHFPSTDKEYLLQLKDNFERSGVAFYCLLIDYGDISNENAIRRNGDINFIKDWINVAEIVGAKSVRVVAGEGKPNDKNALAHSIASLKQIDDYAKSRGIQVVTENFKPLASTKENCLDLLLGTEKGIGLTVDFGNFESKVKYDSIKSLIPYATSIHAKANYDNIGMIDVEEYKKSLDIVAQSDYNGPITLVYDGPGSLWAGINRLKAVVEEYC